MKQIALLICFCVAVLAPGFIASASEVPVDTTVFDCMDHFEPENGDALTVGAATAEPDISLQFAFAILHPTTVARDIGQTTETVFAGTETKSYFAYNDAGPGLKARAVAYRDSTRPAAPKHAKYGECLSRRIVAC